MRSGFGHGSVVGPGGVSASCGFEGPDFGHESGEILLLKRGCLFRLGRVSRGHRG